jgi:hypothetical protein
VKCDDLALSLAFLKRDKTLLSDTPNIYFPKKERIKSREGQETQRVED